MYKAIQTELVRIHTEPDATEVQENGPQGEQHHFRRRLTQLSEEGDVDDEILNYYEEEVAQSNRKPGMCTYSITATSCYVIAQCHVQRVIQL